MPIVGRDVEIVAAAVRAPRIERASLFVSPQKTGPKVEAFLKVMARDRLVEASARYAAMAGREMGKVTLRDTRSRWGSCTGRGDLMYSWRLIMAPPEVLDYVAAHEVAHLVHLDHSADFWALVERLCPGYAPQKSWLKRHGAGLHRFRFRGD